MPISGFSRRRLAAAAIVIAGAVLVVAILIFGLDDKSAATRDFIQYWALEQQLAHGGNPYDPAALLRTERAAGMQFAGVLISLSPPVGLVYALPLGWVSTRAGLALWMLLQLACVGLSVWLLWRLHGCPESRWHVIGLAFPPVLWSLVAGQLGNFFLLEVVLFLYFIRSRPWLAGAALSLCALKPQLFLPCLVVLCLWTVARRQIGVIAGMAAGIAVSSGLTMLVDPQVWSQYVHMMHTSRVMDQFLPTVSFCLRLVIDRQAHWIEFIPDTVACLWAAWYFLQRRNRWDWGREGMLVLLVSVACTPYCWFSDQAMLFPALLAGVYLSEESLKALLPLGIIAVGGLVMLQMQIPMTSADYVWTAPAWLGWYLYAMHRAGAAHRVDDLLPTRS